MVCPNIIVFVNGRNIEGKIIKRFEERGYGVLVDAKNASRQVFFKSIKGQWRGYYFGDDVLVGQTFTEGVEPFDLCIIFNEDTVLTEDEFEKIDKWIKLAINPFEESRDFWAGENLLPKPARLETQSFDANLLVREQVDYYDLRMKEVKKGMLYEVTKPFTDLPYVTLNWNFKSTGHLDFFTSLFVCTSWGVSSHDVVFLKECWQKLDMEGKFDIEEMLNARIERCNSGEVEPQVWRNYLENVEIILADSKKRRLIEEGQGIRRIK